MNSTKSNKGFTIIEVVLVLAIAGLIFLMVFLALPALQRNQRDQQRTQDLGRVVSAYQTYKSNNQGIRPTDMDASTTNNAVRPLFNSTYLENFNTPAGDPYTVALSTATTAPRDTRPANDSQILYFLNRTCAGVATTGKTAVVIWQENGNQTCQEV